MQNVTEYRRKTPQQIVAFFLKKSTLKPILLINKYNALKIWQLET